MSKKIYKNIMYFCSKLKIKKNNININCKFINAKFPNIIKIPI